MTPMCFVYYVCRSLNNETHFCSNIMIPTSLTLIMHRTHGAETQSCLTTMRISFDNYDSNVFCEKHAYFTFHKTQNLQTNSISLQSDDSDVFYIKQAYITPPRKSITFAHSDLTSWRSVSFEQYDTDVFYVKHGLINHDIALFIMILCCFT